MEKLNVCLINDSFQPEIDGVANAVTNYANIISSSLGNATVVTPSHPQADDSAFGFPVLRYPSIDMTKQVGYYAGNPFSADIMRRLTEKNFDIIHTHCPITSTMLARMLRDRIDVPVVFTYHTKFDIDIANAIKSRLLQEEAAKLLVENISACDEVWTVSNGAGENLKKLGYRGEYRVMPNGVDFPKGRVSDELIKEATKDFNLPEDVPMFLFVGRMMWYKGLKIILDALKELDGAGIDFRMVFVGGGGDKDEITEYTEKLGLTGKVQFSEPIRDRNLIRAWYCRADMFLFPSTFDTNGLVVREAAACALGSVLIAGSCAAEDVVDGVSGLLIEENAASMAAKLRELCANPAEMARIGQGAQDNIYISWEDSVKTAYARYFDVIDNYKRGLYLPHEKLTDDVFSLMSERLYSYSCAKKKRRDSIADMKQRFDKLLTAGGEFFEDLPEDYKSLLAELKLDKSSLASGGEAAKKKLRDRLEDLGEHIDRFM